MDTYVSKLLEVVDELNKQKHVLNLLNAVDNRVSVEDVQVVIYMLNDRLQNVINSIDEVLKIA